MTCEQNIFFFPRIVILTSERITRHNMNELCKAIQAGFIIRLHFWLQKVNNHRKVGNQVNSALGK